MTMNAAGNASAVGAPPVTIGPREEHPMPETRRTTLDIPPALWQRAKKRAIEEGTTLRALLLEGLELRLAKPKGSRK